MNAQFSFSASLSTALILRQCKLADNAKLIIREIHSPIFINVQLNLGKQFVNLYEIFAGS